MVHTPLVCSQLSVVEEICSHAAHPLQPSYVTQLAAVLDGMASILPYVPAGPYSRLIIRTGCTQVMYEIRRMVQYTS